MKIIIGLISLFAIGSASAADQILNETVPGTIYKVLSAKVEKVQSESYQTRALVRIELRIENNAACMGKVKGKLPTVMITRENEIKLLHECVIYQSVSQAGWAQYSEEKTVSVVFRLDSYPTERNSGEFKSTYKVDIGMRNKPLYQNLVFEYSEVNNEAKISIE